MPAIAPCLARLSRRLASALAVGAAILSFSVAAPAQEPDDEAFGERVRQYLLDHPEVIVEAITIYQQRQQAQQEQMARESLVALRDDIEDGGAPWTGNADGDVVVVEFFDYQCGFCKRMHDPLLDLIASDREIRFVYKEFPILGPVSVLAARAALASEAQGLYVEYHNALMGYRGQLSEEAVFGLAREAGLDVDQLRIDMENPEIISQIQFNLQLAEALGIGGTPTFIVGEELIRGAVPAETLEEAIAAARSS